MTGTHPPENLQPGSWTEAEVDAIEGHRVRFKHGGEGTVKNAVGLRDKDGVIYQYAVEMTPDGGVTILLSKGDSQAGDWAFDVLPGPRVPEEERQALPEWGTGTAAPEEEDLEPYRDKTPVTVSMTWTLGDMRLFERAIAGTAIPKEDAIRTILSEYLSQTWEHLTNPEPLDDEFPPDE